MESCKYRPDKSISGINANFVISLVQTMDCRQPVIADQAINYCYKCTKEPAGGDDILLRSQRRQIAEGELVLLFNEYDQPVSQCLLVKGDFKFLELLNSENGISNPLNADQQGAVVIHIPTRRPRVLYLHNTSNEQTISALDDNLQWSTATWENPPSRLLILSPANAGPDIIQKAITPQGLRFSA
jgi:hypothetical protein